MEIKDMKPADLSRIENAEKVLARLAELEARRPTNLLKRFLCWAGFHRYKVVRPFTQACKWCGVETDY